MARDPGTTGAVTRELRFLVLASCLTLVLLMAVMALSRWRAGEATARTAAMMEALDLNVLAATPSGQWPRLPGGAHVAVVPRHVSGARPPAATTDAVDR